ncbi:MAG: hypothetical protein WDZ85_01395 [Candidatus Paceibacterota bacterium]
MKYLKLILTPLLITIFFILPAFSLATTITGDEEQGGGFWPGVEENYFNGDGNPPVSGNPDTLGGILNMITTTILNPLIVLIMGISLVVFLWGMVKYISGAGDDAERKKARQYIIWGIIALFVMISVWGFVNILVASIFPSGIPTAPSVPSFQ